MSRTYRKRSDELWVLRQYVRIPDTWSWVWVKLDPNSREGKKELAVWRSDAYREFKEPGPSWFRTLFSQRPYRQESKNELRKFLQDEDYEPMILKKPKLEYWT